MISVWILPAVIAMGLSSGTFLLLWISDLSHWWYALLCLLLVLSNCTLTYADWYNNRMTGNKR